MSVDLFWSCVPDLSKKLKWPVRVMTWDTDTEKPLVYCKADDAYVNINQLVPFPGDCLESMKNKADVVLKNKPATLRAFKADIEWALYENTQGNNKSPERHYENETIDGNFRESTDSDARGRIDKHDKRDSECISGKVSPSQKECDESPERHNENQTIDGNFSESADSDARGRIDKHDKRDSECISSKVSPSQKECDESPERHNENQTIDGNSSESADSDARGRIDKHDKRDSECISSKVSPSQKECDESPERHNENKTIDGNFSESANSDARGRIDKHDKRDSEMSGCISSKVSPSQSESDESPERHNENKIIDGNFSESADSDARGRIDKHDKRDSECISSKVSPSQSESDESLKKHSENKTIDGNSSESADSDARGRIDKHDKRDSECISGKVSLSQSESDESPERHYENQTIDGNSSESADSDARGRTLECRSRKVSPSQSENDESPERHYENQTIDGNSSKSADSDARGRIDKHDKRDSECISGKLLPSQSESDESPERHYENQTIDGNSSESADSDARGRTQECRSRKVSPSQSESDESPERHYKNQTIDGNSSESADSDARGRIQERKSRKVSPSQSEIDDSWRNKNKKIDSSFSESSDSDSGRKRINKRYSKHRSREVSPSDTESDDSGRSKKKNHKIDTNFSESSDSDAGKGRKNKRDNESRSRKKSPSQSECADCGRKKNMKQKIDSSFSESSDSNSERKRMDKRDRKRRSRKVSPFESDNDDSGSKNKKQKVDRNSSESSDSAAGRGRKRKRDSECRSRKVSPFESERDDCGRNRKKNKNRRNFSPSSSKFVKRDVNNQNIYIHKLLKSSHTSAGKKKKDERIWNHSHACFFCKKVTTNIAKHLKKHKDKSEIKEIQKAASELGQRHRKTRALWDVLRNKGDHQHNKKVLNDGFGLFIIGRRHKGKLDVSQYGPCPKCLVWLKLDITLVKHQKICPCRLLEGDSATFGKRELFIMSLHTAGKISAYASKALRKEVFSIMTIDDISETAQSDRLIISLGNMWLLKNAGNTLKRKYYTSSHMRGAARLLLNVRKLTESDKSYEELLVPSQFDNFVKGALITASPDFDDEEDLKSPSTALKLGYDLKRLVGAKWSLALREKDSTAEDDCKKFLKLMKLEWYIRVSKQALITLSTRKFNQERSLPEPDDLLKLNEHIKTQLKELDLKDASYQTFRRAEVLAQTRLLIFNKRRSGEVEVIRVKDYLRRKTGVTSLDKAMRENLSPIEMKLLESQDLLEVRGKFGRGVPVVIPEDLRKVLKYLTSGEIRLESGVLPSNHYLFPNRAASTRVKWTDEELKEVKKYFKEHLSSRTTPGKEDCEKAIKKSRDSKGKIHKRSWETLKKKVWNLIKQRK